MAVSIKTDINRTRRKVDLNSVVFGKVPPQAPELEEAILGGLMLEKQWLDDVLEILTDDDCFYVDAHQKIFAAIKLLHNQGKPFDLLAVTEELRRIGECEIVGGAYFLTQLLKKVTSTASVRHYALIVKEKAIKRSLIKMCGEILTRSYEEGEDVFDLVEDASKNIYKLENQYHSSKVSDAGEIGIGVVEDIEELRNSGVRFTGIPTGGSKLDKITNGWQPTDLIILAARPSVGKTAFALHTALAAISAGFPVLFFSFEMGKKTLLKRLLSTITGINYDKLRNPYDMTDDEFKALGIEAKWFKILAGKLFIIEASGLSAKEVRLISRQVKKKHNIGLIIADYIQLCKGDKSQNREAEVASISREFKGIAMELDLPFIALSQLNRESEKRGNGRPQNSDLRESGSLEQDADLTIFLTRAAKEDIEHDASLKDDAGLYIEKQRNGETGAIAYKFYKETQRWEEDKPDFQNIQQLDNPRAGMFTRLPYKDDDKTPF